MTWLFVCLGCADSADPEWRYPGGIPSAGMHRVDRAGLLHFLRGRAAGAAPGDELFAGDRFGDGGDGLV